MKNRVFNLLFSHWLELPWRNILSILIWSFKLYLLVLAPYLTVIITSVLLGILIGDFPDLISFTQNYFYNGQFLHFIAWRVHLTYFVFCVGVNIFKELEND